MDKKNKVFGRQYALFCTISALLQLSKSCLKVSILDSSVIFLSAWYNFLVRITVVELPTRSDHVRLRESRLSSGTNIHQFQTKLLQ